MVVLNLRQKYIIAKMIQSKHIQNCTIPFPILTGLAYAPLINKVEIKNIYQDWSGESVEQIKQKAKENPYNIRIGLPRIDEQLKNDPIYFISSYLSYNPISKDIENREIITYRNTSKVYIGQSPDEYKYTSSKLIVDSSVVARDYIVMDENLTVKQMFNFMMAKIEKLQDEVVNLKAQLKNETIYK